MRSNKGQLGKIIMIFVGIIVAITLIVSISTTSNTMTALQPVINESVDISGAANGVDINTTYPLTVTNNYPAGDWRRSEPGCVMTGIVLGNSSGAVYTVTTDYIFGTTNGTFYLRDTNAVNSSILGDNVTYVSYNFCDEGYNKDASSRTIVNLILIFASLGILAFVVTGLRKDWF